jgi:hypothetical protein
MAPLVQAKVIEFGFLGNANSPKQGCGWQVQFEMAYFKIEFSAKGTSLVSIE